MIITGDFAADICRILNLDPTKVKQVTVNINPDGPFNCIAEHVLTVEEDIKIRELFVEYKMQSHNLN